MAACASPPKYFGSSGCEALAREAGYELAGNPDAYPIAHTNVVLVTWMPINGQPVAECTLRNGEVEQMQVGEARLAPHSAR